MTSYQFFLLPALAAALLILGGALNQKTVDSQQPAISVRATDNDPQALVLLDRAIDALSPERVRWLEATVWQQVRCDDFTYQACGRLLTAPGDRSRFDMNVKVGKTQAELRLVCDGQTLCQSTRVGSDAPTVTHWDLPAVKDGIKAGPELAQARTRFMQEQGFAGLAPLLGSLRRGLQNAQYQQQTWKEHEAYVISGMWPENKTWFVGMPDYSRPRFQPRLCRIFLDAQTLWPHRLEWWGSEKPSQPNSLLAQTEFRDPVVNRALPQQQCAAEFTIKAGT